MIKEFAAKKKKSRKKSITDVCQTVILDFVVPVKFVSVLQFVICCDFFCLCKHNFTFKYNFVLGILNSLSSAGSPKLRKLGLLCGFLGP